MPKQRAIDVVVDGTPEQVAARLRARTRERSFPEQRPRDGAGGLGGSVTGPAFVVALDRAERMRGRVQAVARGTLEEAGPGRTRVRALCALPGVLVWYLRVMWLVLPALALGAVGMAWYGQPTLLPMAVFMLVAMGIAGFGIGFNVSQAEADLGPLEEAVRDAVGAGLTQRVAERQAETG